MDAEKMVDSVDRMDLECGDVVSHIPEHLAIDGGTCHRFERGIQSMMEDRSIGESEVGFSLHPLEIGLTDLTPNRRTSEAPIGDLHSPPTRGPAMFRLVVLGFDEGD